MYMKKSLSVLTMMTALSAMSEQPFSNGKNSLKPKNIDVTPKRPPIPKGCKRYFFNTKIGSICSEQYSDKYFDAISEKRAYDKFEKWLNQQL